MAKSYLINEKGGVNTSLIVGLVVAVVLVSSILIPILNEVKTTESTFTNEGYYDLDYVDDTYEGTIVWDYTKPTKLTIGTEEISFPTNTIYALTFMGDENFFARWVYSGTDGANSYVQIYRTSTTSAYRANASNSQSMTITIANGNINFDNGSGTTIDVTYDNMYCVVAEDGDYTMKDSSTVAYLKADSPMFAHGGSFVTGLTFYTTISGTPEDGFERVIWPSDTPLTATDLTDDLEEVDGYIGLYTLSKFTYGITNDNTSATGTVTYGQFIVPTEVTVELSNHLDSTTITILGIVPIFVILGLLLAIVRYGFYKED